MITCYRCVFIRVSDCCYIFLPAIDRRPDKLITVDYFGFFLSRLFRDVNITSIDGGHKLSLPKALLYLVFLSANDNNIRDRIAVVQTFCKIYWASRSSYSLAK